MCLVNTVNIEQISDNKIKLEHICSHSEVSRVNSSLLNCVCLSSQILINKTYFITRCNNDVFLNNDNTIQNSDTNK